jgi:hypothetical protein
VAAVGVMQGNLTGRNWLIQCHPTWQDRLEFCVTLGWSLSTGEMHCRSKQLSESTGPILLTSESDIVYFAKDCADAARGTNCIIV